MALKRLFCLLTGASLLFVASTAWSADIHGRSSTQFLYFKNIFEDKKQAEFAEYLNMSVTNIDKAGKLNIQGYGRVTQDVKNDEGGNARLYYLYGDYSGLFDKIDMRFGRQFVNTSAGSALIDGGLVGLRNVGPVAFSVMGGRNVFFDMYGEATRAQDFAFGIAAYLNGFKTTDAELSYFMKFDKDGIARDQVGASFRQYVTSWLKFYSNARYDVPTETVNEVLVGAKFFPSLDLVVTGEWFQSYPTFDNTSIYSVFAVNRFQEGVLRVDYTASDSIALYGGYRLEDSGSNATAHIFEIGTKFRPIKSITVNLSYDRTQGYSGNLNGGTLDVIYETGPSLQLAGGATYDVYQRDRVTGDETARKYWLGGKYRFNKAMSFSVRGEITDSVYYKNDIQGRCAFDYDF